MAKKFPFNISRPLANAHLYRVDGTHRKVKCYRKECWQSLLGGYVHAVPILGDDGKPYRDVCFLERMGAAELPTVYPKNLRASKVCGRDVHGDVILVYTHMLDPEGILFTV